MRPVRRSWLPSWGRGEALVGTIAFCAAVTAYVLLKDIATTGGDARIAIDSAAATIGTLLAYLLLGRFWESGLVRDLLLSGFLLLLGFSNAVFAAVPHALGRQGNSGAAAVAGVLAGAAFLGATWLPQWRWRAPARHPVLVLLAGVVAALVLSMSIAVANDGVGSTDTFGATRDASLTVAQLVAAALFAIGALGSARRIFEDSLFAWLAAAGLLSVGSRFDFAMSREVGDAWYTAGTCLRLCFYAVLLAASAIEIRSYWQRVAALAVLEERRRLARDLHDGLAQELAFAATQARGLAEESEHPRRASLIAAAAERALDESRRAIAALTRPLDEPLELSLAQCAEEVCDRFDAQLVLDVQSGLRTSPETREALLRVVREAVSNAARHSGADEVRVRLRRERGLELRIEDDGRGFDVDDIGHLSGRFGMLSMRERVQSLGGTFTVVSRLPGGTAIEVTLP
jgi:signal transduction histidine kinase